MERDGQQSAGIGMRCGRLGLGFGLMTSPRSRESCEEHFHQVNCPRQSCRHQTHHSESRSNPRQVHDISISHGQGLQEALTACLSVWYSKDSPVELWHDCSTVDSTVMSSPPPPFHISSQAFRSWKGEFIRWRPPPSSNGGDMLKLVESFIPAAKNNDKLSMLIM
ncbi:uncharacterized protein K489DRAFT_384553 [Dissoconium aciculare CBS 342.82]|uniref:Uncharacterized protein n=1 Tax=Dissoconium aciculare CBS 342.82 TaxID=1314786 RepID=A0A6J3LSM8_9PEZI|nr:uncharacterized protein K489DRAFT_384553 [Dissoconium aciculare CBS 342.82]KAF1818638.1 hypothetical protein K489DRAFT_384553 [Dissoconium aciculare CBS 342.82]